MEYEEINDWSEAKLEIIKEYAQAYSTILSAQKNPQFSYIYIDGFAGTGKHISKKTKQIVEGSPANALKIKPPFHEYHLIDMNPKKVKSLKKITGNQPNVHIYEGDCNEILFKEVFPKVQYKDYRRALCLLDPYGMHLEWKILYQAGQMRSVEIFFNFSIMDANMNVLRHNLSSVDSIQIKRMNSCWGDESWKDVAYDKTQNLFGWDEKMSNDAIVKAFQKRLKNVAGFKYVPDPVPMRNRKGATVYYLYFASQRPVASKIVEQIFEKYKNKGVS